MVQDQSELPHLSSIILAEGPWKRFLCRIHRQAQYEKATVSWMIYPPHNDAFIY